MPDCRNICSLTDDIFLNLTVAALFPPHLFDLPCPALHTPTNPMGCTRALHFALQQVQRTFHQVHLALNQVHLALHQVQPTLHQVRLKVFQILDRAHLQPSAAWCILVQAATVHNDTAGEAYLPKCSANWLTSVLCLICARIHVCIGAYYCTSICAV